MISKTLAVISGTVVRFAGHGRQLGYPTANIHTDTSLKDGVYFGRAHLGEFLDHPALIFIGTPTTVGDTGRRVEAHLLDIPDRDYYGLELRLKVLYFHRPSQTFDSIDELLVAMKSDEKTSISWFQENSNSAKSR